MSYVNQNPETPASHQWVLWSFRRSSLPGLHGWDCVSTSYTTEADARAAFDAPWGRDQTSRTLLQWQGERPRLNEVQRKRRPRARKVAS